MAMATSSLLFVLTITLIIPTSLSQDDAALPPASDACNGVFLSYNHSSTTKLPPNLINSEPAHQPYRFESTLYILNNGLDDLMCWKVFVGFRHDEFLVSASNAVLADGTSSIPGPVGNGTVHNKLFTSL